MCAQLATYCRKSNDAFDVLLALDGTALTSVFEPTVPHISLLVMVCPSIYFPIFVSFLHPDFLSLSLTFLRSLVLWYSNKLARADDMHLL